MKVVRQSKIITNEGDMMPIFRNWDQFHNGYEPKMVYATTMNANTVKGPILHKERKYFITAITGTVDIEFIEDGVFTTVNLHNEESPDYYNILLLDENIPIRLINKGSSVATVINCPSKAWHPDNPDTYKYGSWEAYQSEKE